MADEQVKARYQGNLGENYHRKKRGIPKAAFSWVSRLRAEKFAPYFKGNETVLEYGVGWGWNLASLKCQRKIGFDVSEMLADEVRASGIEFVNDTKSLAVDSCDAVICHHTLEHALHPPEILQEIKRLLRPGGLLLLQVPFEKERRYWRFNPEEPNHHLYSWNVQTLGNLVSALDFQILEAGLGEFGYDRFAAAWAEKLGVGETGFRFIRRLAHTIRPLREVRIVAKKKAG